ncbi:unnamed protein product [Effrenium voratum]|nr:unnamed protein product [Effrenium voratum]
MVDGEQHHNTEELLQFSVMKFEELFPDDEEPWWDESDKPDKTERKVMFDHGIFFEDSGVKNGRFHKRREENDLIPEHGYCSSTCFTRFPNDTFGKKRYVLKKPDDPVESIARVEMKLQLRHVLPLMRYTSAFKACVPINSLELPLRSNLQIILKESGKGEQFNYTVDRVTNMISIGVLASNPPGPICAATLLSLQLMSFANRFYTNYTSAVSDARLEAQKEQEKEEAAAAEGEDAPEAPLVSPTKDQPEQRKSVKALPGAKKGKKKKTHKLKTLTDAFLEIEVFKLFMQSMVLFILCLGQFGFMPGPLCAIGCIITCCVTMIVMNIGTFRKEINKQIESLAESLTEMYRMIRSYQVQALNWLNGENRWGYKFIETGGEEMVGMENVTDVSFVVPELGLRLQGKATVDDLLPADEKLKQQLLKYTACRQFLAPSSLPKGPAAGYAATPAAPTSLPSSGGRAVPPPGGLPAKPAAPSGLPKAEAKGVRTAPPPPRALPAVSARAGPSDSGFSAPPPPCGLPGAPGRAAPVSSAPAAPVRPAPKAPASIPTRPAPAAPAAEGKSPVPSEPTEVPEEEQDESWRQFIEAPDALSVSPA